MPEQVTVTATSTTSEVTFADATPDMSDCGATLDSVTLYPGNTTGIVPVGSIPKGARYGGGGGPQPTCDCSTGKPVDLATGDYYDTAVDLSFPYSGVPIQFTRTYDAQTAQNQVQNSTPAREHLGYGWFDNLDMSVSLSGATATVTEANGAQITFQKYTQGQSGEQSWCPSDQNGTVYCPTSPSFIATLSQNTTNNTWTYANDLKSPLTYNFNGVASATLASITDAQGDLLSESAYTTHSGWTSCPTGDTCHAWESEPAGETAAIDALVEVFNSSSQLIEVYGAVKKEPLTTFTYGGTGCATADLCTVTDPGSMVTTFTYDSSNSNANLQYDELTMVPSTGSTVTNTFNTNGQVSSQTLGDRHCRGPRDHVQLQHRLRLGRRDRD